MNKRKISERLWIVRRVFILKSLNQISFCRRWISSGVIHFPASYVLPPVSRDFTAKQMFLIKVIHEFYELCDQSNQQPTLGAPIGSLNPSQFQGLDIRSDILFQIKKCLSWNVFILGFAIMFRCILKIIICIKMCYSWDLQIVSNTWVYELLSYLINPIYPWLSAGYGLDVIEK